MSKIHNTYSNNNCSPFIQYCTTEYIVSLRDSITKSDILKYPSIVNTSLVLHHYSLATIHPLQATCTALSIPVHRYFFHCHISSVNYHYSPAIGQPLQTTCTALPIFGHFYPYIGHAAPTNGYVLQFTSNAAIGWRYHSPIFIQYSFFVGAILPFMGDTPLIVGAVPP